MTFAFLIFTKFSLFASAFDLDWFFSNVEMAEGKFLCCRKTLPMYYVGIYSAYILLYTIYYYILLHTTSICLLSTVLSQPG